MRRQSLLTARAEESLGRLEDVGCQLILSIRSDRTATHRISARVRPRWQRACQFTQEVARRCLSGERPGSAKKEPT